MVARYAPTLNSFPETCHLVLYYQIFFLHFSSHSTFTSLSLFSSTFNILRSTLMEAGDKIGKNRTCFHLQFNNERCYGRMDATVRFSALNRSKNTMNVTSN